MVLLQELKCEDHQFPLSDIEELGYNVATFGQKAYNGVAILSLLPLTEVTKKPFENQSRHIEAVVNFGGSVLRLISVYVPNGNPINSEKFPYKLRWLESFTCHIARLLETGEPFIIGGDYNALLCDLDSHNPENWDNDALGNIQTKRRMQALLGLGLVDAHRVFTTGGGAYSYWDYRKGSLSRNEGLLLDRLLASPKAADWLVSTAIDPTPRSWEKASDHTPVLCLLDGGRG